MIMDLLAICGIMFAGVLFIAPYRDILAAKGNGVLGQVFVRCIRAEIDAYLCNIHA